MFNKECKDCVKSSKITSSLKSFFLMPLVFAIFIAVVIIVVWLHQIGYEYCNWYSQKPIDWILYRSILIVVILWITLPFVIDNHSTWGRTLYAFYTMDKKGKVESHIHLKDPLCSVDFYPFLKLWLDNFDNPYPKGGRKRVCIRFRDSGYFFLILYRLMHHSSFNKVYEFDRCSSQLRLSSWKICFGSSLDKIYLKDDSREGPSRLGPINTAEAKTIMDRSDSIKDDLHLFNKRLTDLNTILLYTKAVDEYLTATRSVRPGKVGGRVAYMLNEGLPEIGVVYRPWFKGQEISKLKARLLKQHKESLQSRELAEEAS